MAAAVEGTASGLTFVLNKSIEAHPLPAVHEGGERYSIGEPTFSVPTSGEKLVYSQDGTLFAALTEEGAVVCSSTTGEVQCQIATHRCRAVAMSPKGTFLVTWGRPQPQTPNLIVWRVASGEQVAAYIHRPEPQQAWPVVHWSDDEDAAVRCSPSGKEVFCYDGEDLERYIHKGSVKNAKSVSISHGAAPHHVAVFIGKTAQRPASVVMYPFGRITQTSAVAAKSAFVADSAVFDWSPDGRSLLFQLQTETSADSYYGASSLFLMSTDGRVAEGVRPPKEGIVHDAQWNPNSREFLVIAGHTPPRAAIYDTRGNQLSDLGEASVNSIFWNPQGNFFILAGFSNMGGGMRFFERGDKPRLIGTNEAMCVTTSRWAPDGRVFMVATTRPRMQVDNGVRLYRYNGDGPLLDHRVPQLYDAQFRPVASCTIPPPAAAQAGTSRAGMAPTEMTPEQRVKERKKLNKRLAQIRKLKADKAAGKVLDWQQSAKVEAEAEIERTIAELTALIGD